MKLAMLMMPVNDPARGTQVALAAACVFEHG